MAEARKIEFLRQVIAASPPGPVEILMTYDTFVKDNVRIAAEALQLGVIRLAKDPDGLGYQVRITPGGRRLAAGDLAGAAAEIDHGFVTSRLHGDEPNGPIGARLAPGDPPLPLGSSLLRVNAPEVLRGIATGHLRIEGGLLHAVPPRRPRGMAMGSDGIGRSSLGDRHLQFAHRGGPR